MAVPTNPTKTTLVTEALKMAGYSSPSAANITRGEDEFLEWVKNDIWRRIIDGGDTQLKTLQTTSVLVGIIGQRRYATPDNFDEPITIAVLDATFTGIAQGSSSSQFTLAATETATEADVVGKYCFFPTGTAQGQYRQCLTYSESTNIATVDIDWDSGSEPVSGDTYWIIDDYKPIELQSQMDLDDVSNIISAKPNFYSIFNEEIYFDNALDNNYGVRLRYYANLSQVDLTEGSTELITKIYRNWRSVLIDGVTYRALLWLDDSKSRGAKLDYEQGVQNLILKESPSYGELEQFTMEER